MMLNHAQSAPFTTVLISSLCPVHRHSVSNQFHFPMILVGVYTWNCLDPSRGAKRMVRGTQLEAANVGFFDATSIFWFDLPDSYMLHLLTYSRKTLCHLWSNVLSNLICYQILGCCRSLVNGKVSDLQPMISLYYWAAYIPATKCFLSSRDVQIFRLSLERLMLIRPTQRRNSISFLWVHHPHPVSRVVDNLLVAPYYHLINHISSHDSLYHKSLSQHLIIFSTVYNYDL